MFRVGETVCLKKDPAQIGVVQKVIPISDTVVKYRVLCIQGGLKTYYDDQLEPIEETSEDLFIDFPEFLGRYGAFKYSINSKSTLYSLNTGNIKFIPFQFRPLTRILKAERPRILIADEVGVGKTIETGLILKEFEMRGAVDTVMIVAPKDLTQKWKSEMKNRFDERFLILNSTQFKYCLDEFDMEGVWPEEYKKCIVGLEMVRNVQIIDKLENLDISPSFSMIILDEAHHVINSHSNSHKVMEYFCSNSNIAVFLSATPLQLQTGDLYNLLHLLMPEEFMDKIVFKSMAEPNQYINGAIRAIRNKNESEEHRWQQDALKELSSLECNAWARQVFKEHPTVRYWKDRLANEELNDEDRISCLNDLETLHTFGHVMNRTKRKDIGEFTTREPYTVEIEYSDPERKFYEAATQFRRRILSAVIDPRAVNLAMSTIERQITSSLPAFVRMLDHYTVQGLLKIADYYNDPDDLDEADLIAEEIGLDDLEDLETLEDFEDFEEESSKKKVRRPVSASQIHELEDQLEELRAMALLLPKTDSKVEKLLEIVDDTMNHIDNGKLLVFSYFRNTLNYLLEALSDRDIRTALITGSTSAEDREQYRARFRLDRENPMAIDVLLSSEVGCEGLDYEFCSRMVNYDIPWNPMKIEQRIGRIDRFGQKSPKVQIYNFITYGTVEERIFYRCFDRLGIFNSTIGDLELVLGNITKDLTEIVFDPTLSQEQMEQQSQQVIDNTIRLHEEQQKYEKESRELFLMDLEQSNTQIETARENQVEWFKQILTAWVSQAFPKSKLISKRNRPGVYELRFSKTDRRKLEDMFQEFSDNHDEYRNFPAFDRMDQFLGEERDSLFLNFGEHESALVKDHEVEDVDSSNPLIQMAIESLGRKEDLQMDSFLGYTCCQTKAAKNLPAGHYVFGIYEWLEEGYRKSNDLMVIMLNQDTGEPCEILPEDFDSLLLNAKAAENTGEPDPFQMEAYLSHKRQAAIEKLAEENQIIVERKLATIDNYYKKEIADKQARFNNAKEKKIRKMYENAQKRLKSKWAGERKSLLKLKDSDISVEPLFFGKLEVCAE